MSEWLAGSVCCPVRQAPASGACNYGGKTSWSAMSLGCLPSFPVRRQQEKGVITGSAVRYRTDDRVGAVSAAQVCSNYCHLDGGRPVGRAGSG